MKEQSDHDLLVCIDVKLRTLTKHFENHIKHHWMVTIPLISIIGGLVVTLIITLIKLL